MLAVAEPCPSTPRSADPQHLTVPLSRSAHDANAVSASAVAVRPAPKLITGRKSPISPGFVPRLRVSSRPSWPLMLYPQHLTWFVSRIAHVWYWLGAIT